MPLMCTYMHFRRNKEGCRKKEGKCAGEKGKHQNDLKCLALGMHLPITIIKNFKYLISFYEEK